MRTRLDREGKMIRQICLPQKRREQVMKLAHKNIGHLSKEKVVGPLQKSFYWLYMWKDVGANCGSCEVCQHVNKANPR